jgi:hypothetical protein
MDAMEREDGMNDLRMLKYPLFDMGLAAFDDTVSVAAYPSSGVNFIGMQDGIVTLWSLVDAEAKSKIERRFHIAGTGHPLPAGPQLYLGTVFERRFVWHIFELFG